ncbi:hypothetical protein ACTJKX_35210, partial [Labrys sp. 22185]
LSEPDWPKIASELKRKGVTLTLLWQEYRADHPDGYGYTCYVAARLMWRSQGKCWFSWREPQHKFERRAQRL